MSNDTLAKYLKETGSPYKSQFETLTSKDLSGTSFNPDFSQAPVNNVDTSQVPVNLSSVEQTLKSITEQTQLLMGRVAEEGITTPEGQPVVAPVSDYKPVISPTEPITAPTGIKPPKPSILDKILGRKKKVETKIAEAPQPPTFQEALKEAAAAFGMTPEDFQQLGDLSAQIGTINTQIAELDTREQQALFNIEARPGIGVEFMGKEQKRISREYAIKRADLSAKANALQSQAEMIRGNYAMAKNLANEYIKNITYQKQKKIDDLKWSFDIYQDILMEMKKDERDDWNALLKQYETEQKAEEKELGKIRDMMTNPDTAGAFAGIPNPMELSIDEATRLVSEYIRTRPPKEKEYAPLEIEREWELAGGESFMPFKDYLAVRRDIDIPRAWSDSEIESAVKKMEADDLPYEEALREFAIDPTVQNQERAREIVNRIYGVSEEVTPTLPSLPGITRPPGRLPVGGTGEKRGVLEERGIIPFSELETLPLFE